MPPKKVLENVEDGAPAGLLNTFTDKETKLLAAAFVSSIGVDKYDYELMASLTNNTAGSLKKMWPPVKKKAMENNASFTTFLTGAVPAADVQVNAATPKATSKTATSKKRKVTSEDADEGANEPEPTSVGGSKPSTKKKAAPNPRNKKAKKEDAEAESKGKAEEGSAGDEDDADKDLDDGV